MSSGARAAIVLPAVGLLLAAAVGLTVLRDRWFATDRPAERILYVQSPAVVKRLALSYQALAADVYWIRALQHFGGARRELEKGIVPKFELLHPLLDMTTALDPYFNIAYRFGAIFLSQPSPGGPGRPDQAIALLEKGLQASPDKWQYMQDAGFVEYWTRHDYKAAAAWFERGSRVKGAPSFLRALAATTLAQGGDRRASRLLFQTLAETGENDWMRDNARWRLRQLDAMDAIDQLQAVVQAFKTRGGSPPFSWEQLVNAGFLRGVPQDPDGVSFELRPWTGDVALGEGSPLAPLPQEPPRRVPIPAS